MFLYLLRRKWLADVTASPAGQGLYHMRLAALRCNHDHGHVFRLRHSRKLLDKLQPVHDWHIDVTKNQVNLVFREHSQRLGPVACLEYFAEVDAGLAQRAFHDFPHDRGIVHDEGTYAHEKVLILRKGKCRCFFLRPLLGISAREGWNFRAAEQIELARSAATKDSVVALELVWLY